MIFLIYSCIVKRNHHYYTRRIQQRTSQNGSNNGYYNKIIQAKVNNISIGLYSIVKHCKTKLAVVINSPWKNSGINFLMHKKIHLKYFECGEQSYFQPVLFQLFNINMFLATFLSTKLSSTEHKDANTTRGRHPITEIAQSINNPKSTTFTFGARGKASAKLLICLQRGNG